MTSPENEAEFHDLKIRLRDKDSIIRGCAAVDLGLLALEDPIFKEQIITLLQTALNDPDKDVRESAHNSLQQIEGKQLLEPGKQIIGFGYLPEEYRQQEVNPKQQIISCVCCVVLILVIVFLFTGIF